ncbi:uncharacterized protein LOC133174585 [Saccostrea echinata]|uniref:uncharacterized protein LOC133174585 n=1 Tax=Saccostrea echinata TaxID=191078 RepID=UPI002A8176BF|nr:uncharacterized protein LOC133174585 [Saccostrea echinata]
MRSIDKTQSRVVRYSGTTEIQTIQYDSQGRPLFSTGDNQTVLHLTENSNGDICVADHVGGAVIVVNSSGGLQFNHVNSTPTDHSLVSTDSATIHHLLDKQMSYLEKEVQLLTEKVSSLERNRSNTDTEMSSLKQKLRAIEQRLLSTEQQNIELAQKLILVEDLCNRTNIINQNSNLQEERLKKIESDVSNTVLLTRTLAVNGEKYRNRTLNTEQNVSLLKDELRNVHLFLMETSTKSEELNSTLEWHINSTTLKIQKVADIQNHVGFTAGVTIDSSWAGSTLVFNKLIYSNGGGFDTSTGVFTSPVSGMFVFYVSTVSKYGNDLFLDIVLNGAKKVRTMSWYPGGTPLIQTGTNAVFVKLQTGDRVWIQKYSGGTYHTYSDAPTVTFTGFQL